MTELLGSLLEFAIETAYLAGRLTLGYFQTGIKPEFKGDHSPVTLADQRAEELIRSRIAASFPGHAIVGEEFGEQGLPDASYRWFIDPIDGTRSFVSGVPLYAVLLGLEIDGAVQVGAAYFPALDEMLTAATGQGCWWNGRKCEVSKVASLDQAVVAFTNIGNFSRYDRAAAWDRLMERAYFCAGWGDAYGHMLVATGRADLMLDPIMNSWDCGPFPVILAEAGGYFGDWAGNPTIYGDEAISTNLGLLPEVLAVIQGRDQERG